MKTPSGLSYATRVTVYLDGKPIGEIRESVTPAHVANTNRNGFRYFPKGGRINAAGDWFPTLDGCKASLA